MAVATVSKEQAGTYRQLAQRLRVQRGAGQPDAILERPRDKRTKTFLDGDSPTLVTFAAGDQVDVAFLLSIGALATYNPPQPARPPAKEGGRGEGQ